ncbi:allophanate hydrolase subunit 1 [Nocardioides mesophilus]|uniref:Allophanate hydrolase subunit 1 n=1 Tax=Nocardioides mesophilus TaxID=433659 RepID=A0A7G9RHM5_9ACTN|nr:allophanate hydrolase subunit 1 [Nocardioides mesophilus]
MLAYGDRALLVELGSTEAVVRYVDALRARSLPGVADLVPAAETVLVVAAAGTSTGSLRQALADLEATADGGPAGEDHSIEIPVRYDGPDLADVARLTGLTEADVVAAHTGAAWRVAFGGFAPGFGYLVGGDARLEVPRRDSARTCVPAGAVGLAGSYSGIYPRESPGGWQLIGTTSAPMWDLDREPPALLRPGAVVRFVEEESR